MKYLITTIPNLEDIAIEEIEKKLNGKEGKKFCNGKFTIKIDKRKENELFKLLSINHFARIIKKFSFTNLEDLKKKAKIDLSNFINLQNVRDFKVDVAKSNCNFSSIEIAKAIGEAILKENEKLKVNLRNPSLIIRADIFKNECILSIQITKTPLYRRGYRKFKHPKSINTIIAHAMIKISRMNKENSMLDPFCGVGTIPIEAYLETGSEKIYGCDKNPNFIEKAIKNASLANAKVNFSVYDATKVSNKFSSVDFIITNPPYGKEWREKKLFLLYNDFFKDAKKYSRKICIITTRESWVKKFCREFKYRIIFLRRVLTSTFWSSIILLENLGK